VPAQFSQVASDILAQKYFRKAGVPARLKKVEENDVPSFLWRSVADEDALAALPEEERYGSETDARQVFTRLAGTWTYWGWKGGYFDSEDHARAFMDELCYMLATQSRPGPLLRRPLHPEARQVEVGLRAPAAARLLHPVRRRRPRQRGRHHGPVGA
jgi:ribonucleotide reductase alpha subunit